MERKSDLELEQIISTGRPDFGMPAFRLIGPGEIKALVGYLRILQGGGKVIPISGDPHEGRLLFFGKGGCSSCHRVRDEGGFLAPDLSTIASRLPAAELRRVITHPDLPSGTHCRLATVRTHSGETLEGVIRNEDNFSLQLQASDGVFHFLAKADLESLRYKPQPSMHVDSSQQLSAVELDDLVSFLHSLKESEDAMATREDEQ